MSDIKKTEYSEIHGILVCSVSPLQGEGCGTFNKIRNDGVKGGPWHSLLPKQDCCQHEACVCLSIQSLQG